MSGSPLRSCRGSFRESGLEEFLHVEREGAPVPATRPVSVSIGRCIGFEIGVPIRAGEVAKELSLATASWGASKTSPRRSEKSLATSGSAEPGGSASEVNGFHACGIVRALVGCCLRDEPPLSLRETSEQLKRHDLPGLKLRNAALYTVARHEDTAAFDV
jgi:hypothetical protein